MRLLYRRIIFFCFVILFCILVPTILLYATGHTINWRRLSLEKTGSVLIDSAPSEANVILNGEKLKANFLEVFTEKSPLLTKAKINNLAPGEYTIRLEKTGFWPWEEKFRLSPGEVANFGKIGLFSQAKPELIYELNEARAELSPSGDKIVLLKNNSLSVTNINNDNTQEIKLPQLDGKVLINWSDNNKKIALNNLVVDLEKKVVINLSTETKQAVSLLRWGNNDDIVYFVSNKKIFRYTITSKTINSLDLNNQLNGQEIIDYLIRGDQIYIITGLNNKNLLIGSLEGKLNSLDLPAGNYKFNAKVSPKPVLVNDKTLFVLDEPLAIFSKPRLLKVSDRFKLGHWQDNSLTYATTLELRRWDKEDQEYLLNRFGSNINELWPINKKNSIIVATPDDIQVYVNGQKPFTINLAPIKNSQLVTVTSDAKTLYVYGEYEGRTGIFKLTL